MFPKSLTDRPHAIELASLIENERQHQERKWGTIAERPHSLEGYLILIRRELQEVEDAWAGGKESEPHALAELVQVMALAHAAFEEHGVPSLPSLKATRGHKWEKHPARDLK